MWQCEVLNILCVQQLDIAVEEKPKEMNENDWAIINRQACSTIRSSRKGSKTPCSKGGFCKRIMENIGGQVQDTELKE